MSDPMTSAEVEDILSSIRRLVSEETRAEARTEPAEDKPKDRLVLTPSLRVEVKSAPVAEAAVEADAPDADTDEIAPDAEAGAAPDALEAATFVEDAALDAPDTQMPDEEPEGAAQLPSEQGAPVSEADIEATETAEIFGGVSAFRRAPQHEKLTFGTLRATDDTEPQDVHVATVTELTPDTPDDVADTSQEADVAEDVQEEPSEAPAETLSEKIAALETLIARRSEQWEPDDTGAGEAAGTHDASVMAWEDTETGMGFDADAPLDTAFEESNPAHPVDAFAQDVTSPLEDDAAWDQGAVDAETSDPFDADADLPPEDAIIDEAAMRELIAELVREELQGALGERITRNVRKLVRREIHRALAAQDLE